MGDDESENEITVLIGSNVYYPRQTVMWLSGYSRKTIEGWVAQGKLVPARTLGNLSLYKARDVHDFLDSHFAGIMTMVEAALERPDFLAKLEADATDTKLSAKERDAARSMLVRAKGMAALKRLKASAESIV